MARDGLRTNTGKENGNDLRVTYSVTHKGNRLKSFSCLEKKVNIHPLMVGFLSLPMPGGDSEGVECVTV